MPQKNLRNHLHKQWGEAVFAATVEFSVNSPLILGTERFKNITGLDSTRDVHMLNQIAQHLNNSSNTAFVINDISYSYKELSLLVKKHYHFLEQNPDIKLIGLVMRNDIETYAFMIATFLSNCGYVILNIAHPIERNALIATDASLKYVVSSASEDKQSVPNFLHFIGLDTLPEPSSPVSFKEIDPDAIAYILFTSGSTGNPKGVKITKRNLNAFLGSLDATPIAVREQDSVLQLYDLTFDASILMLLPALCKGATIYTASSLKVKILDVARILASYPISYVFLVPSVIALLRTYLSEVDYFVRTKSRYL